MCMFLCVTGARLVTAIATEGLPCVTFILFKLSVYLHLCDPHLHCLPPCTQIYTQKTDTRILARRHTRAHTHLPWLLVSAHAPPLRTWLWAKGQLMAMCVSRGARAACTHTQTHTHAHNLTRKGHLCLYSVPSQGPIPIPLCHCCPALHATPSGEADRVEIEMREQMRCCCAGKLTIPPQLLRNHNICRLTVVTKQPTRREERK